MEHYRNYKFYEGLARQLVDADYNLNSIDKPAHFLCEASRVSKHGIGGSAFRNWVAGLFLNGVYLYANNYDVGIRITEVPTAKLTRGCQDSAAHGSPWPKPNVGVWVVGENVPVVAQKKIEKTVKLMLKDASAAIINKAERLKAIMHEEMSRAAQKRKDIEQAWA